YNLALPLIREVKDRQGESGVLNGLGTTYSQLARPDEALRSFQSALPLAHDVQDRESEAMTLCNLMSTCAKAKQFTLATAYGKQAINVFQTVRGHNQNLDTELQRSLLAKNRIIYERVASLMIKQNQLEEAEQVLRFLRQEDVVAFAKRDAQFVKELTSLSQPLLFTSAEKAQLPPAIAESATIGQGVQESRLWQQALQEREKAGDGRVALISTFNMEDGVHVILTTSKGRRAFSSSIKSADFDVLSQRLQDSLSQPDKDPRPDALKMYQVVFCDGQLEQALQQEGITTALWFSSGSLRYIPIDALYDGTHYLVQKPRANVYVTLASRRFFEAQSHGAALVAGVSKAHEMAGHFKGDAPLQFGALSNVPQELRSIVRDEAEGGTGPLAGRILLDHQFTAANLEKSLSQGASVVHIATHFALSRTEGSDSFLLLGDGSALPLTKWKEALKLKGVGLLTLSACETGIGQSDASGGEVSSIGEVSQYLGAQSAIVSLWPVADSSTADLMSDFYKRWHGAPERGKAWALREAQRALLGTNTAMPADLMLRGKPQQQDGNGGITFIKDLKHPYAHPFYWAPFSLIGNWK
ncbi:MAG: CHAT domain-containing protein, partial [Alphaproteobacteria bacterium]